MADEKKVVHFGGIPNLEVDQKAFESIEGALNESLNATIDVFNPSNVIIDSGRLSYMRFSALALVNSLFSAVQGGCREAFPAAPIHLTTNENGELIYQCEHNPPHIWKVSP